LETLITKIKKIDEFDHFKTSIYELKQNNQQRFMDVVSALPANKQNYLKEVMFSQRIVLNSENSERTAVRKIVKIKKPKK